jgi:hypothetical protein
MRLGDGAATYGGRARQDGNHVASARFTSVLPDCLLRDDGGAAPRGSGLRRSGLAISDAAAVAVVSSDVATPATAAAAAATDDKSRKKNGNTDRPVPDTTRVESIDNRTMDTIDSSFSNC